MKKVNLLVILLYINNLILIIANSFVVLQIVKPQSVDFDIRYSYVLLLWFVIYLIVSIINIISILLDYRNNSSDRLFKKMKRVKITLIPFWIINFICYFPISVLGLLAGHGFGFLIVPIFIFVSYMVLLLTSIFSISYLLNLRKNKIITGKQLIMHSILQLCFVIDIIDTIYIIRKWGKQTVYKITKGKEIELGIAENDK